LIGLQSIVLSVPAAVAGIYSAYDAKETSDAKSQRNLSLEFSVWIKHSGGCQPMLDIPKYYQKVSGPNHGNGAELEGNRGLA
jgi:hypothetical protein